MTGDQGFGNEIKQALESLVAREQSRFPAGELLRIDLHCHDRNSDVTDEPLGRMLRIPETWLPTADLLKTLRENRVDAITITNHNNARTCWELLEQGMDVLPGAEFSCTLPDFQVGVHVLTYGFTPEQETHLQKLRKDLYRFLEFTCEQDIPTVLAHPLHFYSPRGNPPMALFDTLGLLFERFEVLNGQRDTWQSLLTSAWVESLTPERLESIGRRQGLAPSSFCRDPYRKASCGGSDDHMGIFAGFTGSVLHVPDLEIHRGRSPASDLALAALRAGRIAPYGTYNEGEKLALALLDYFCQVALHMKDPGLIRLILHRGTGRDKLLGLFISNAILEIRRHRYTMKFLAAFHESLSGKSPGFLDSLMVSRSLRPIIQQIERIAAMRRESPDGMLEVIRVAIPRIFRDLNQILSERMQRNLRLLDDIDSADGTPSQLVRRFEIPTHWRSLLSRENMAGEDLAAVSLGDILDGLPFPALGSVIIAGASFASHKVMYKNRKFLNRFAARIGRFKHPRRALWLTDTLHDPNGVSTALGSLLEEIQKRDLPIDLLVCDGRNKPQEHLVCVPPVAEYRPPVYRSHVFRIPDLLQLQDVFRRGWYDRIVASTELVMGLAALYLKTAFTVPAFFYVHTDWLEFADKSLALDVRSRDRIRRLLRAFYRGFDGLIVLNSEHSEWLAGPEMGIPREKICTTAHWVGERFRPVPAVAWHSFPGVQPHEKVLLFVGRISEEKGIMQLPAIYSVVKQEFPEIRLAVAGAGPALDRLRAALPDALYLGWVDTEDLPRLYSAADLLLLPSRFDTFGCVVLEAMSCGLPVAAYNTKGPKDIIRNGVNGLLAESEAEFPSLIARYLADDQLQKSMRSSALETSSHYRADDILKRLVEDIGLSGRRGARRTKPGNRSSRQMFSSGQPSGSGHPSILSELLDIVSAGASD